jgi:hypothetical protein
MHHMKWRGTKLAFDLRTAFQLIQCKMTYYAIPECWTNSSPWLNERGGSTTLLTDSQQKRSTITHTLTHLVATALQQLLSAVSNLHVFVARLPPLSNPPSIQIEHSVATGGCRPNKWRQPRDTPPFVLNDVTVPRICKLFLRNVNVG